jgi:methionine-rich copper-binding protein CopC
MTDERIVAYLLKELPDEELERFEDECFEQESWPAQLDAVEEDLIEDYLREGLAPERRTRFEQNYLATAARRERVRMAAALLRLLDERQTEAEDEKEADEEAEEVVAPPLTPVAPPPPTVETWAERFRAFWGGHAWAPRAVAALALVLVAAGAWSLYSSRTAAPQTVAALELNVRNSDRAAGTEQPGRVKLAPDTDALRVALTIPEGSPPSARYRVELENRVGETKTARVDGQEGRTVSVLIPSAQLARGRYVLKLFAVSADGAEQRLGSYFFNVE